MEKRQRKSVVFGIYFLSFGEKGVLTTAQRERKIAKISGKRAFCLFLERGGAGGGVQKMHEKVFMLRLSYLNIFKKDYYRNNFLQSTIQ